MLSPRFRRALVCALAALALCAPMAVGRADAAPARPASSPVGSQSPTPLCDAISPIAIPCVALNKVFDAVGAECRRVGIPDALCRLPLAHKVTQAARDAYLASWVHRTAAFQYELGDSEPLTSTQWIGTHNSFNSLGLFTLSHADSNQQLSLSQQLDIDVRAIELDLHYIPRLERLGAKAVTVCHGQAPSTGNLGCTIEPVFSNVLPEVAGWLNGHSDQVILLYLEDEMENAAAYASTLDTLNKVLRRPDGSSLIYRPDPADRAANGCSPLPLDVSRDDVRAAGAQVVLVGTCVPGWSSAVFDWNGVHVESGSTSAYQTFPGCDATYGPSVYDTRMVRYFEDSTLVSALINPTRPPVDPEALSPAKVAAMTECGVNVFGFDQILPEDGRIQSTLWSWAPDEPRAGAGGCALQGADGRWVAAPCTDQHRAACVSPDGDWSLTDAAVTFAGAPAACAAAGAAFGVPRAGDQNARLRAVAAPAGGAWVNQQVS